MGKLTLRVDRFIGGKSATLTGVSEVRLDGESIVGTWGDLPTLLTNGDRPGALAEELVNCSADPESIAAFTLEFGPLIPRLIVDMATIHRDFEGWFLKAGKRLGAPVITPRGGGGFIQRAGRELSFD